MRFAFLGSWGLALFGAATTAASVGDEYVREIEQWRAASEERLKSADGWLTVSGLYWLQPGDTRFGSAPGNRIVLPAEAAPQFAGVLRYDGERVQVIPLGNIALFVGDQPVLNATLLQDDSNGPPDTIKLGDVSMLLIKRGDRLGVRIKDKNAKLRLEFTHRNWFPVKPGYRVNARYHAYAKPIKRRVPTVLDGVVEDHEAIGTADFTLNGQKLSLEALKSGAELFFVFRDQTANKQTYGAARFLYAPVPKNGNQVVLDFNKAYNPPCAFNPYTTCPLPVKQNILQLAIEAGELKYHD